MTGFDCLAVDTRAKMGDLVGPDGKYYYGSERQPFKVMTPAFAVCERQTHEMKNYALYCVAAFTVISPIFFVGGFMGFVGAALSGIIISSTDKFEPKLCAVGTDIVVVHYHKLPLANKTPKEIVVQTKKEQ